MHLFILLSSATILIPSNQLSFNQIGSFSEGLSAGGTFGS